ncbi:MAG TPA: ABC-F family ATP-binding cassette domain-containing protein [Myxococcota bacterium]|nr:ABC-F family ATP-binding cassette domain-containing protein [Myxococcota bacterium]HQK51053.1 ABC-F family ATP-binding cassette domain-containing protein [Myxococcota bacterium]
MRLPSAAMVELIGIAKSFGSRVLFRDVHLRVGDRERVGLVGPNGSGKTTLFRILAGEISPDAGRIERKKGIRLGYLPQEVNPSRAEERTPVAYCAWHARDAGRIQEEHRALLARIEAGDHDPRVLHQMAELEEELRVREADALPKQAESVLLGLGLSRESLERPVRHLSGGLLMRVELARLLLDRPDLLLLDEPINHLDLEGLMWFEDFLKGFPGAMVVVAHDREFLNRAVDRVVEVSPRGATDYGGNPNLPVYDRYLVERQKAVDLAWKRYEEQQAFLAHQEEFIAANKVRKDRAGVVQARIRMLEKLERLEPPESQKRVRVSFPQPPRLPELVLSLQGVTRRYGDRVVFRDLDLRLHRGERLALVGVNGAGKSTLLRLVAGRTTPDEGLRLAADSLRVGYFAQDQYEVLRPEGTVHQHMLEVADVTTGPHVRGLLGAFLFREDDLDRRVQSLSGGEKARLMLARLLLQAFGLLVLDEPTNHLDIASREVLEEALRDYQGTLIFTSHDRRFMDAVATGILELKEGRLTRYAGNWHDYRIQAARAADPEPATPARDGRDIAQASSRDLERERKREEAERRNRLYRILKPLRDRVQSIEAEIDSLEKTLREVEDRLTRPDLYADLEQARKTGQEARLIRQRLDGLYAAWEEATEALGQAEREA